MVSFKSNGMKRIHPEALQPQLKWLILTDNELESLPSTIGRCTKLQKCMLSGNQLSSLPQEIENCHNLELIRLASNRLTEPPMELLRLPNLCWIAFSDNPFVEQSINQLVENNSLEVMENIEQHELLGTRCQWRDASSNMEWYNFRGGKDVFWNHDVRWESSSRTYTFTRSFDSVKSVSYSSIGSNAKRFSRHGITRKLLKLLPVHPVWNRVREMSMVMMLL